MLDVTDEEAVAATGRLSWAAVDIVISNAVGPMVPERPQSEQVDVFVDVANRGAQACCGRSGRSAGPAAG